MPVAGGLYYERHGDRDAPPLILSAGLGGSGRYWEPNLDALAEHFQVILYDQRGTGRSDRALPQVDASDEGMTFDLKSLMDDIGIVSAHIMGHAAGAMIAMRLAVEWPERVRSLVLVNGWAQPDPHFARCFEARLALLHQSGVRAYVRAQPIFLFPANWISEHSDRLEAEEAGHIEHFPAIDVMERRIEVLRSFDFLDYLQHIDAPVLALASEDDMLVPSRCGRRIAEAIPGAQFATMQWGGHGCNVTDPETFNRIVLEFLGD